MNLKRFFITFIISLILISCGPKPPVKIIGIKIYDYQGKFSSLASEWNDMGINTCYMSNILASNKEFRENLKKFNIKAYLIFPVFQNPEVLDKDSTLYAVTNKGIPAKEDWVEFVCPSRKTYREQRANELATLVNELKPDGVSIDFIRQFVYWEMIYPDRDPGSIERTCFCDSCIADFTGQMNISIPDTCLTTTQKAAFILKNYINDWNAYRCNLVTGMVTELVDKVKRIKPDIKINVHVVPWRENDFDGAGISVAAQDLKKISSFTDYISPMCYSQMLKRDAGWIESVVRDMDRQSPGKILPSIQVYPEYIDNSFTTDDFKDCINKALAPPSLGVVFYSWPLFEKDTVRIAVAKEVLKRVN